MYLKFPTVSHSYFYVTEPIRLSHDDMQNKILMFDHKVWFLAFMSPRKPLMLDINYRGFCQGLGAGDFPLILQYEVYPHLLKKLVTALNYMTI